jgi:hypothetical protein
MTASNIDFEAISPGVLERFREKKTRQTRIWSFGSDSIRTENALDGIGLIRSRPVFRFPFLLRFRIWGRRPQALDRPEVERGLIDVKLPIKAPVPYERGNGLVANVQPIGFRFRSRLLRGHPRHPRLFRNLH